MLIEHFRRMEFPSEKDFFFSLNTQHFLGDSQRKKNEKILKRDFSTLLTMHQLILKKKKYTKKSLSFDLFGHSLLRAIQGKTFFPYDNYSWIFSVRFILFFPLKKLQWKMSLWQKPQYGATLTLIQLV